jgi:hypothetical protein
VFFTTAWKTTPFGKIDAGPGPFIGSVTEAAVEVIIGHPRSSEMILWLTHQRIGEDDRGCSRRAWHALQRLRSASMFSYIQQLVSAACPNTPDADDVG